MNSKLAMWISIWLILKYILARCYDGCRKNQVHTICNYGVIFQTGSDIYCIEQVNM